MCDIINRNGKMFAQIEVEVIDIGDSPSIGQYVLYDHEVYKFGGYERENILLIDIEGNEKWVLYY